MSMPRELQYGGATKPAIIISPRPRPLLMPSLPSETWHRMTSDYLTVQPATA
jgi:hypothetical protein